MSKFDELLTDLAASGALSAEDAERIRQASDGSPLRRELEELRTQAQATQAERDALRASLTAQTFDAVGIKVRPEHLKLPDDLDTTNAEKVRAWATEAGLVSPQPSAPAEELAAHDRMAQVPAGSSLPGNPASSVEDWLRSTDLTALPEEQFWAAAAQFGRTQETARE